ncbi:MAG: hypothetical protein JNM70_06485 [Anaerolineae bacterium]|nr:hypothetical protein [Anaerolineae bacterium]
MQIVRRFLRFSSLLLGLIFILVTFAVAVIILNNDVAVAIITAGATVFVSVFSALWARSSERTQSLEQQIREKKTPIYEGFIEVAFDIIWSARNSQNQNEPDSSRRRQDRNDPNRGKTSTPVERLQQLTPHLVIWGTDEVISSWVNFRMVSVEKHDKPLEVMLAFESFMSEIRRDLGHKGDILKRGDLLKIFVNDVDEHLQ